MTLNDILLILSVAFSTVSLILVAILLSRNHPRMLSEGLDDVRKEITGELRASRAESTQLTQAMNTAMGQTLENSFSREDARLKAMQESVSDRLTAINQRLSDNAMENEQKLENMRLTMEKRLTAIQEDNNKQLTEMRATVDEKLQKTLEERLGQSFKMVSEQLEAVYKSMGEMQNLATGVGDLKKVLSNVKTRGIFGEIQLGAILDQILAPEQYDTNVVTVPGSTDPVEFAVKFPGDGGETVYLPIDSKFPMDVYQQVLDAYDTGEKDVIDSALKFLSQRIQQEGKKIHDKYVKVPYTTDFAVMFLPVEGLYAEVVRTGVVEVLQRNYKVSVAGPTTMAALLNSLQMGFRTLAIQKRSGEVWKVLGEVKNEFDTFGTVLETAQSRIVKANEELDKLIGVRTRQIQRKLKDVSKLPSDGDDNPLLPGE